MAQREERLRTPAYFEIQIGVRFLSYFDHDQLIQFNGFGTDKPGKLKIKKSLAVSWSQSGNVWYARINLGTGQHSLRTLIDEFDKHKQEFVAKTTSVGNRKFEILSCNLVYYPHGLSKPEEKIEALEWSHRTYLDELKDQFAKDRGNLIPVFVPVLLGVFLGGKFIENTYTNIAVGVALVASLLLAPCVGNRVGSLRRVSR